MCSGSSGEQRPVQPTCFQVQRDPRLVDVRRVALGADPPDRPAVDLLLRGRRHVRPAGQRSLASGETARDPAPPQQRRAPARADGVGGGRDTAMMERWREEERLREGERRRRARGDGGREKEKETVGWEERGGGERMGWREGKEEDTEGWREKEETGGGMEKSRVEEIGWERGGEGGRMKEENRKREETDVERRRRR